MLFIYVVCIIRVIHRYSNVYAAGLYDMYTYTDIRLRFVKCAGITFPFHKRSMKHLKTKKMYLHSMQVRGFHKCNP